MHETYTKSRYRRWMVWLHSAICCLNAVPSFLSNEMASHLSLFLSVFPSVCCCASVVSALELMVILILSLLFLERLYLEKESMVMLLWLLIMMWWVNNSVLSWLLVMGDTQCWIMIILCIRNLLFVPAMKLIIHMFTQIYYGRGRQP